MLIVAIPVTLRLSSVVPLETSKPPFASIALVKVERPITVTLPSTLSDLSMSTISLKVEIPVTTSWSSTVTVPPAESITRLPVEVSISLSPLMPIWILSIVAPLLASIVFVKVERPVTVTLPSTLSDLSISTILLNVATPTATT